MKKVKKIRIIGEITADTLTEFMDGDPQLENGFMANDGPGTRFEIYLASPGGDVDTGMAIYELLRCSKAEVVITGYGIVGSIAVLIFAAGKKRILTPGTRVFLHPGSYASGAPESILTVEAKTAELIVLHRWYCEQLAERMDADTDLVAEMCSRDCFLSADAALDMGIATSISCYAK